MILCYYLHYLLKVNEKFTYYINCIDVLIIRLKNYNILKMILFLFYEC